MTRLLIRLADITTPAQILDSGDDTVNGTAAERFCITREAAIGGGVPFTVSPGNHHSDVTTLQLKGAHIAVLDGQVIDSDRLRILGDSDPSGRSRSATSGCRTGPRARPSPGP